MPAYDYKCPRCEDIFEVTRSANSEEQVCCPDCGVPAKRVFTPIGVHFKGSGFHNTDYGTKGRAAKSGDTSEACPASTGDGGCASCPKASGE